MTPRPAIEELTIPVVRARDRRGAAVFVVVLVITLLSALGLFAVRESTTAVAANTPACWRKTK